MEEYISVFKDQYGWARRLVKNAAVQESDFVDKVASIMDKHLPSHKESGVLKGIV